MGWGLGVKKRERERERERGGGGLLVSTDWPRSFDFVVIAFPSLAVLVICLLAFAFVETHKAGVCEPVYSKLHMQSRTVAFLCLAKSQEKLDVIAGDEGRAAILTWTVESEASTCHFNLPSSIPRPSPPSYCFSMTGVLRGNGQIL